jgi:TRAP-type mannitol/chloroaromatic compound transport system substrate-binding protein
MTEANDQLGLKRNFVGFAIFLVVVLLVTDVVLRVAPGSIRPGLDKPNISAVGYHQKFDDGSSYYIYTIFESNGDVYQCWWDQDQWNQKKVTNYRGPTLPQKQ